MICLLISCDMARANKVKSLAFNIFLLVSLVLINPASAQTSAMAATSSVSQLAIQIDITGPIGPATADYVTRSLQQAVQQQAQCVILQIDTPGGLNISMRKITEAIIAAPLPVITYVAPGGAHAASAGTYIVYASHIAAMAPATNLGAATPVQLGSAGTVNKTDDAMTQKMVNDAVAYIRSLAEMRGRNIEWAEKTVYEAASLSAEQALELDVIDIIATDSADLLRKIEGNRVIVAGHPRILHTANIKIQLVQPDWRSQFLAIITDPNVAYILMLLGIYGLVFELSSPGGLIPGVIGTICLLLSLYAMQTLPINSTGLALIWVGIAFMIAEAFVASFGILGIGGTFAFVIGSIMLMDTGIPGFGLDLGIIFALAIASVLFLCLGLAGLVKMRNQHIVSGSEELLNSTGIVEDDFEVSGWIHIHGEKWRAESDRPLSKGEKVQVRAIDELTLFVTPTHPQSEEN